MTYIAALFDMDGLLIDSERAIMTAWLGAARSAGLPLTESVYKTIIRRSVQSSAIRSRQGRRPY